MRKVIVRLECEIEFEIADDEIGDDWSDQELCQLAKDMLSPNLPGGWTSDGLENWCVENKKAEII